jgi:hypothetical protein
MLLKDDNSTVHLSAMNLHYKENYVNELDLAVDAVLRDALDRVEVHPCDENNDLVKFNGLSDDLKYLFKVRHAK